MHVPLDSVHVELLNEPAPELAHDTVVVGVVLVPVSVSLSVTVYVIAFPAVPVDGLGVTVVLVVLVDRVSDEVPELVLCLSSPA